MRSPVARYPSVSALGFWSALLAALESGAFFAALLTSNLDLAFGSACLLAPTFVALMVSIHHAAAPDRKVWSQLGLAFAGIYAGMSSFTYYLQLTVIQPNPLPLPADSLRPFVFIPGTPVFALDMLGYAFMCLSTLAAGPVFRGGKLETWIRWLFSLHAALFLFPTLALPAIPLPAGQAGAGIGDQIGVYANLVWSAYFAVTTGLVAALFRQQRK